MKKAIPLLLALTLCFGLAVPAMATEPEYVGTEPTEPDLPSFLSSITVYLPSGSGWIGGGEREPWTSGPLVTLTNVYDRYGSGMGAISQFCFYTDTSGTVTFNQDVTSIQIEWGEYADSAHHVAKTEGLKAGIVYNVKDLVDTPIVVLNSALQSPSVGDEIPGLGIFIYFAVCEAEDIRYGTSELSEYAVSNLEQSPAADTPSSWAEALVNEAIAAGLVPETLQAKYKQATTRAEFCALAAALYETVVGEEITERVQFSDTSDINVEKMAALGVVNGMGENEFAPDNKLTREQAATMLSRLADAIGKPLTGQEPTFADNEGISSWAFDAVGQMQATGIMGGVGDNTFSPATDYTREQSIVTILRLFDIVK